MRKGILFLALFSLCFVAGASKPGNWQLEETLHFYIYYQTENAGQLKEIGALAESVHKRLTAVFPSTIAGKTHLVLTDWTDESNGFANVFPYPQITLYLAAPQDSTSLGLRQMAWLEYVLTHEYAHVLQLGAAKGIPANLRKVFGSAIVSAAAVPPWAYEGWAVYAESNLGPVRGGRLAEPSFRAMLRHDLLEGNLKRLDQASNLIVDWPGFSLWYSYGALFFEYLVEEYGQGKLVEFFQSLAAEPPAIRFVETFENTYGLDLAEAYQRWQGQLGKQVGASSQREGTQLTSIGASTNYPAWDSEGNLYYLAGEYNRPQRLMKYNKGQHTALALWDDEAEFVLGPEGELIFTQARWQGDNYYFDLYTANQSKGEMVRLTQNLRAREPALSPDGKQLAFVALDPPRRQIYLLDLEHKTTKPLLVANEEYSFHSPAWSPDGKVLAVVTEHKGRGRQLEFVELETGARRPVTGWFWQEGSPAWDPSGRYLLFTAQAEGLVNLYAYDLEAKEVKLVTPDGGPAKVSPDGSQIAYVASTAKGNEIYLLSFQLQGRIAPPGEVLPRQYTPLPQVESKTTAYRAWPSLRPHFWLPMVQNGALGAVTMGKDALGFYSYTGFLGLDLEKKLKYNLDFKSSALGPELEFSTSSRGNYALRATKYWRSIFVPNGTLALGGGWSSCEGSRLSLTYTTARSYGLNPSPSRGLTLRLAASGLGKNQILKAQATRYAPLGKGVLVSSLTGAWGQAFTLPGSVQLAHRWAGSSSLEIRWPLVLWQRGLLSPPVYLVDSWGAMGLTLAQGGDVKLQPALAAEFTTRFTVGFVPSPLAFTVRLTQGLASGKFEGTVNFTFD